MLKDYIFLVLKRKKLFFPIVIISTVCSLIISLLLPKWYLAEASFLPPELATNTLLSMSGGLSQVIQSFTGQQNSTGYSYLAILNSRTINESVVNKFNLKKVYNVKDSLMSKTLKKLSKNVDFSLGDNNETVISVYDKNPQRAADIANYYIELLNKRENQFATQELTTFQKLIQNRVALNNQKILELQDKVRTFQQDQQVPVVMSETINGLDYIGELYTQKISLELQRDYLKQTFGTNHPMITSIDRQLSAIQIKIDAIPDLTVTYMEIYREFLIQQKIAEFIVPMFEQVSLSAAQKIPDVVVLDKATPPDRKKKPKRALIVIFGFLLSTITMFFYILLEEKYAEDIDRFWDQVKSTW